MSLGPHFHKEAPRHKFRGWVCMKTPTLCISQGSTAALLAVDGRGGQSLKVPTLCRTQHGGPKAKANLWHPRGCREAVCTKAGVAVCGYSKEPCPSVKCTNPRRAGNHWRHQGATGANGMNWARGEISGWCSGDDPQQWGGLRIWDIATPRSLFGDQCVKCMNGFSLLVFCSMGEGDHSCIHTIVIIKINNIHTPTHYCNNRYTKYIF